MQPQLCYCTFYQELQIFKATFRYINVPLTVQTPLSAMLSFPCEGSYKALYNVISL